MIGLAMGHWARTGRFSKAVAFTAAGLAGGGAAIAVASVPDSSGVIHACYSVDSNGAPSTTNGPNVTVIDPNAGQTCSTTSPPSGGPPSQAALSWNTQGPPGATGAPGQQGPAGTPAAVGSGLTITTGLLTLPGGQVLTVESSGGGVTLPNPPAPSGGTNEVVMTGDRGSVTYPILSLVVLASQAGTSGGRGVGARQVTVRDISVTRRIDATSTKLAEFCVTGQHFKTVTITLAKKGGAQYLRYTLSSVYIIAEQVSGGHGDGTPTETVTFAFGSSQVQYVSQSLKHHGPPQTKVTLHLS